MEVIVIPRKRYVYFDDTGNILSISNTIAAAGNYIQVPDEEVEGLISGKEQMYHYQVIFDTITKTYALRHKYNDEDTVFNVNNQIHQIKRKKSHRPDIRVIQDLPKKQWKIMLDKGIRENFKEHSISIDKSLMFSITKYNDPHILERVIVLRLRELIKNYSIKIPFETKIELDPTALSVYTVKRLESYQHEVINAQKV
jgi:hypothetical protein